MERDCYFRYVYNTNVKSGNLDEKSKKFQNNFSENIKLFPNFPDAELISDLSYENYERKVCTAKLIFIPFESLFDENTKKKLDFSFDNKKMPFDRNHIRLIRKVTESLDEKNAMVLVCGKDGTYHFEGIINESKKDNVFLDYYFVNIIGYSNWSASCKDFELFDFKNGYFCDYDEGKKVFKRQLKDIKDFITEKMGFTDGKMKHLDDVLEGINKQKHGTSLIIFKESELANNEADRLCDANRGFKAENPVKCEDFIDCIPLFTKIDGGIFLDTNLTCYAYGCIYDGDIPDTFKGSLEHGSRYNSTVLYTLKLNSDATNICCVGIVFSDDGGVRIAKIDK